MKAKMGFIREMYIFRNSLAYNLNAKLKLKARDPRTNEYTVWVNAWFKFLAVQQFQVWGRFSTTEFIAGLFVQGVLDYCLHAMSSLLKKTKR